MDTVVVTPVEQLTTLLLGVVFGLALAAPPGPMNAIIAEESVLRGWTAGVRAGLGAASADVTFFVLALLGAVTVVERIPSLHAVMLFAGGLLMLYFAYDAARESEATFRTGPDGGGPASLARGKGFSKAFVLALTNPYQILFWLTIGVGMLRPGEVDVLSHTPYVGDVLGGLLVVRTGSPALLVGFFGGIAIWVTGFPAALVAAERRMNRLAPVVAYASAAVLAGFGVYFLADAVTSLS
jgi:threonine/homoserine/homoserine lactone efflux protein